MDIATVVGLILGAVVIVGAILLGGNPLTFIDPQSVVVVLIGSIAAVLIAFPLGSVLGIPKVLMKTVFSTPADINALIARMVDFAEVARRDGILSLENHIEEKDDAFVKKGVQMAVDGTDPEFVEQIMDTELENLMARHAVGKKVFDSIGRYAPAFGMIGTLIGLVAMLSNMSDPSSIGGGMAVALLTTMYGAIVANVFALPLADKLATRSEEEVAAKTVIIRGIMSIQEGDNPRVIAQKLQTYLPPGKRPAPDEEADAA